MVSRNRLNAKNYIMKNFYAKLLALVTTFLVVTSAQAQCSNCASQYPFATQTIGPNAGPLTISTCMYGSDYAICNVVSGTTYTWSTCGDPDFDTQITVRQDNGTCTGTVLAYNDDFCGLQSQTSWTATYTGTVRVLVSAYYCSSQFTCMTLTWSSSTPAPPSTITPPVCYDMNGNTGGFTNGSGGLAWVSGATTTPSSGTGPQGADASGGSGFFFTEASGSLSNTTYSMVGYFDLSAGGYNLTFDYHMYGNNLGTLSVLVNGVAVWSQTGGSANAWISNSVDLSAYTGSNTEISIVATTGNGWSSDIAIDNVCINNTPSVISGCTDPLSLNYNPAATIDNGSCFYGVPQTGSNSYTLCSGNIYDNGGPSANYANSSNGTTTIYPGTSGMAVQLLFNSFNVETCCDYLAIYDGNSTAAPLIGTYTASPGTVMSTASDGSLTLVFYSDGSVTYAGFDATVSCVTPLPADPTSATASSASICEGSSTTLTATGVVGTAYWFEGSCATSGQIGTGSTLNVSPTTTTTYYVRNNDGQWSANCASVTVTVNPLPTVNAGPDAAVCAGLSAALNGSASSTVSSAASLSTTFAGGNGQNGNMFDINVLQNITITDFDVNSYAGTGNFEVYYKAGSYVGSETNAAAWTLLATASNVVSNGAGVATPLNLGLNLSLTAGQTYSFYVTGTNQSVNYTNGTAAGSAYASNTELIFYEGVGKSYPFGATYSPRIWNGTIHYTSASTGTPAIVWTPAATLSNATILNPVASPTSTTTYTLTATANGCSASDDVVVTVDQPSTAAASIAGAGSACLGTISTLSVQGGSLSGSSNWEWYEGSCGGTLVGTGNSIAVTPGASTTYFVAATANGACPATACISGTITLPTPSNVLSGNNITATCTVNQNGYIHLLDSNGDLVASINSNGQNLGTVTATSYIEGSPLLVESCGNPGNVMMMTSVMDRHWVITTQNAPTGPVSVLLPFTDNEAASLNLEAINNQNPDDNVMSIADIGCTKYSGPNEDNLFDNDCTSNGGSGNFSWHAQTANGQVSTYLAAHPSTNKFITIDVNSFSEFWLHGSANNAPLPVELTSFQANCLSNSEVEVTWSTASEYNSSHYIVSKSYDGINWEEIKIVQAAGMSQTNINYAIIDQADPNNRTVYYSLNQYDIDGISKEFKVTKTTCSNDDISDMIVYPNPGYGVINLKIVEPENKGICQVIVSDLNGSIVIEKELEIQSGTTTVYLNGMDLTPGLYMINYLDQGGKLIQTIKYSKM